MDGWNAGRPLATWVCPLVMYGLITGWVTRWREKHQSQFRVLVLGLDASGKSTLVDAMHRYCSGQSGETSRLAPSSSTVYRPTVGLSVTRLKATEGFLAGPVVHQQEWLVWDLGGELDLRKIWNRYVSDADALIWVVDASDPLRFPESMREFQRVGQYGDAARYARRSSDLSQLSPDPGDVNEASTPSVLVVVNQWDKVSDHSERSKVLHSIVSDLNKVRVDVGVQDSLFTVQSVCAMSGEGVAQVIHWLAMQMARRTIHRS